MNDFIKQQQELALDYLGKSPTQLNGTDYLADYISVDRLNNLIQQIITNTGEEMMRLAEGERLPAPPSTATFPRNEKYTTLGHNAALDTLKQHITSVTGVE